MSEAADEASRRGVWIVAAYKKVSDHIGKIIATIGGTLMMLDVAGQGDGLKSAANEFLGPKGAQKIGIFLFVVAFLRFLYTGYKENQRRQQIDDLQTQVDSLRAQQASTPASEPPHV